MDGNKLLRDVNKFHKDSFNQVYYAPFAVNSKNWQHIPEATEEWFERCGALLKKASQLSRRGHHSHAVSCFALLYETIFAMEEGEEIVFADEYGSWMLPVDEKVVIADYMTSLAATCTSEEFAQAATPLIRRDSYHSFADKVRASANRAASKEQKAFLNAEIHRLGIRTQQR